MLKRTLQSFSRAASTSDGWAIFVASKVVFFCLKIKIWESHSIYFDCIYPLLPSLATSRSIPSPYYIFSSFLFFPFPTQITLLVQLVPPTSSRVWGHPLQHIQNKRHHYPLKKKPDSPYSKKLSAVSICHVSVGVFEALLLWWIADRLNLVQAATAVESS